MAASASSSMVAATSAERTYLDLRARRDVLASWLDRVRHTFLEPIVDAYAERGGVVEYGWDGPPGTPYCLGVWSVFRTSTGQGSTAKADTAIRRCAVKVCQACGMWRMRRVALLVAFGAGVVGSLPSCDAPASYEVSAVTAGKAAGALVTVTKYAAGMSSSWVWTLDGRGELTAGQWPTPPPPPSVVDCAGANCYRVVTGELRVEESRDSGATYTTAWQVADHTRQKLAQEYDRLGDPGVHLSSRSAVVQAAPGGHVVFVANGRDGVLYRSVDGAWHRLGVPMGGEGMYFQRPPRLDTDPRPVDPRLVVAALTVLLVLLAGGATAAARRTLPPLRAVVVLVIAVSAGVVNGLAAGFPDVGMFPGYVYGAGIIAPTLVCATALAVTLTATAPKPTPLR